MICSVVESRYLRWDGKWQINKRKRLEIGERHTGNQVNQKKKKEKKEKMRWFGCAMLIKNKNS